MPLILYLIAQLPIAQSSHLAFLVDRSPITMLLLNWLLIQVVYNVVFLADTKGNSFYREGKAIEFDPAYDLAVLKVTLKRTWTKMPLLHRTKLLCWNIV
ncbi:uncharacterized protein LOC130722370 isoform X2 [Lotus japonicus]|nr:uncharacterized protein LOC130722370 isoform X2 [Lotus japonicus]